MRQFIFAGVYTNMHAYEYIFNCEWPLVQASVEFSVIFAKLETIKHN